MPSSTPTDLPPSTMPPDESRRRAERLRAMLERWQQEDTSGEPDWDPERVAPAGFRAPEPTGNGAVERS